MTTTARLTPFARLADMADADSTLAIERLFTTQKRVSEHSLDVNTH